MLSASSTLAIKMASLHNGSTRTERGMALTRASIAGVQGWSVAKRVAIPCSVAGRPRRGRPGLSPGGSWRSGRDGPEIRRVRKCPWASTRCLAIRGYAPTHPRTFFIRTDGLDQSNGSRVDSIADTGNGWLASSHCAAHRRRGGAGSPRREVPSPRCRPEAHAGNLRRRSRARVVEKLCPPQP
jgi:hypothetical protein